MLLPKPEPRARVKARADRVFAEERKRCREIVYARECMRCQRCRRQCSLEAPEWADNFPHVNETVPRSRGGNPTNPDHCELICRECHFPNGQHAPTAERQARLTKGLYGV
jgi:5-methylcytosine-specific restriction endonuclease McrA